MKLLQHLLLMSLIVVASGCQAVRMTNGIPNLAQVEPGVWRGGQPTDGGWKWLKDQGVLTVIKLNTDKEGDDSPAERYYGMRVWRFPLTFSQQLGLSPIPEQYFKDGVDGFPFPEAQIKSFGLPPDYSHGNVFIHCSHGQDRTGLFVACYRTTGHQEGWLKPDAEKEMLAHGFHKELRGLWEYWEHFDPEKQ